MNQRMKNQCHSATNSIVSRIIVLRTYFLHLACLNQTVNREMQNVKESGLECLTVQMKIIHVGKRQQELQIVMKTTMIVG